MKKIVLTGGPCGGKSAAKNYLEQILRDDGWRPVFVTETATVLNRVGLSVSNGLTKKAYQKHLLAYQLETEDRFEALARTMPDDRWVFICDRGAMDGKAYLTEEQFGEILSELNISESILLQRYDGVFHLDTAVKGAAKDYQTGYGTDRNESKQQALALDQRTWSVWEAHPVHIRIPSLPDFDQKMVRLGKAVLALLNG